MKKYFFFKIYNIHPAVLFSYCVQHKEFTSQKCVKKYKIPSWTEISNTEVLVDLMF